MTIWTGYTRGVNLGGWLSQCPHTRERYETFIGEEDIHRIRDWGLDHIRVPVDYELVEDAQGARREEGFAYIQRAIDWSRDCGLNMILDLHKTCGFSFDAGEHECGFFEDAALQERFYRLWEEFARRFGRYADTLSFELLNEVTEQRYCAAWNRIAAACIARIRAIAPTVKILVGGYWNNSIEALPDLRTLLAVMDKEDLNLSGPVMELHQKCAGGNEKRVALFAHQGFSTAFMSCLLDVPYPQYSIHFDMQHTGMTVIHFPEEAGWVVPKALQVSSDAHLYRAGLPTTYNGMVRI